MGSPSGLFIVIYKKNDWIDLLHLEHPDKAIDQLCPSGQINPDVVESALRSGSFFLIPFGEAMSPLLRYIVTINTNNAVGNQQSSEWQLSSNTHSDHLTSTLKSLFHDVREPVEDMPCTIIFFDEKNRKGK